MKKETILQYLKISVMADLLIQYADIIEGESPVKNKLNEIIKDLEPLSNAMYEIDAVRKSNIIQEIQNKIDTIFRHSFREIEIKK